jgi:hypothetical protein
MSLRSGGPLRPRVALLLLPLLLVVGVLGLEVVRQVTSAAPGVTDHPPPAEGYFATRPPGSWRSLPSDSTCTRRVHRSMWEPRPDNSRPNHRMPDEHSVHAALATRPRAVHGAYPKRWDRWLLHRVTGHFTGTTDEVFQWAACKWGLSDNLLRAIADRESGWYQYEVYPDGSCVVRSGCGDLFEKRSRHTRVFCSMTTRFDVSLRNRYPSGRCPKTYSIVGVMSWQDPAWGPMRHNQNGTFPFNRDSTAFAVDYVGGFLRGCYEGWVTWLHHTGRYQPGNMRGCVGAWYDGAWFAPDARTYVDRVWRSQRERPWLRPGWSRRELPCSPAHGCPQAPS